MAKPTSLPKNVRMLLSGLIWFWSRINQPGTIHACIQGCNLASYVVCRVKIFVSTGIIKEVVNKIITWIVEFVDEMLVVKAISIFREQKC